MHRIVLAGSVNSSFATLKKLVQHKANVVGVLGYEPDVTTNVSGYANMKDFCVQHDIPYYPFKKIGSVKVKEIVKDLAPDLFFVVGLSQIVPADIISIPKLGNIGFHPTVLPKGRGRAPIAWLVLQEQMGAANFFLMSAGVDDGPLFVQETFPVTDADTAASIEEKILVAIDAGLDKWLPKLQQGIWEPVPQDESIATYYAKRTPEDGWINWNDAAVNVDKVIRASAAPHPGAYTFLKNSKLIVEKCRIEHEAKIQGVNGSVLLVRDNQYLVQVNTGHLWISDIRNEEGDDVILKVGERLGYYTELEVYELKKEVQQIKQKLGI